MNLTLSPQAGAVGPSAAAREKVTLSRTWMIASWLTVIVLGALQAWDVQHGLDPDGVAYLDMGDAFFRGDWRLALNALWPPLYAWLVGLTMWIVRPPARLEFVILHALNLLIYLASYVCFLFLIRELIRYQRWSAKLPDANMALTNEAWLVLGTALFLWSALRLISVPQETPDMCAAALIYIAFGLLLRIRRGQAGRGTFALLGGDLALAYLTKYFMLGLAFVFLAVAMAAAGRLRAALPRGLLAVAAFFVVASPFIIGLSLVKGRLTTSHSGTLIYLFEINHVPYVNWQGGPPGTGVLLHPTVQVYDAPAIYEFAGPIGGTYPPWDDPDYWLAGGVAQFDFGGHMTAMLKAAALYVDIFILSGSALLVGCVALYALEGTWRTNLKGLAGEWVLLVPALSALGLLAIIHVESRHIGAFAAVLWIAVLSGIRLPAAEALRPMVTRIVAAMALAVTMVAGLPPTLTSLSTAREWLRGRNPQPPDQWEVASALHAQGIPAQDKIAFMGNTFRASAWARLARVQIVAEIPLADENAFWALDDAHQVQAMNLLAGSGAHVLVTKFLPSTAPGAWQRLGQTDYYIYWLR